MKEHCGGCGCANNLNCYCHSTKVVLKFPHRDFNYPPVFTFSEYLRKHKGSLPLEGPGLTVLSALG